MKKPGTAPPSRRTKSAGFTPISTAASPCLHRAVSAVPFSWEQHPGIAKPTIRTKSHNTSDNASPKSLLPPPPPMSLSHFPICPPKKNSSTDVITADPFELAFAECAKAPPTPAGLMEEIWGSKMVEQQRTRWRFRLGVYGICNEALACSIVDSKVHVPRAAVRTASCRILSHGRLI